jgi:hypothetical protein
VKEKLFLLPGSSERPADVFIPHYSSGKDLFIDIAITCPLQHKYVAEASHLQGFACNNYADEVKRRTFESRVADEGGLYLPAVFESFGGFSKDLPEFFSKMTHSISLRFSDPKWFTSKRVFETFSCALMKSIARSISSRLPENFGSS